MPFAGSPSRTHSRDALEHTENSSVFANSGLAQSSVAKCRGACGAPRPFLTCRCSAVNLTGLEQYDGFSTGFVRFQIAVR
jgi:hypothetical protein